MTEEQMILAVDAAMVEMANIHPPLRRSECERLIRAALAALQGGEEGGEAPTLMNIPHDASKTYGPL